MVMRKHIHYGNALISKTSNENTFHMFQSLFLVDLFSFFFHETQISVEIEERVQSQAFLFTKRYTL